MPRIEPFSPDIPDEYLLEIGRASVRWTTLESVMDLCLIKLVGKDPSDPRSLIIFNHMAFPMKIDVMGSLMSELLPGHPNLSGYENIIRLLKKAQEKRNLVVHSKWALDEKTGQVVTSRLSARGKLKITIGKQISVDEIRDACDVISEASYGLWALVVKAGTTNKPPQRGQ